MLRLLGATCLVRSAVLQRWDTDHGHPRPLVIGVAHRGENFAAHAWRWTENGCRANSSSCTAAPHTVAERAVRTFDKVRSPEIELVIRCARADAPDLTPSLRQDIDWPTVIATARAHGVLALIGRRLEASGWHGVPEPVVEDVNRYRAALAARNLYLAIRLVEVLAALNRAGVAAIAYKGPVLGDSAYGDLRLRPFKDLDILVARRDVGDARRCLEAEGYRSLTPHSDERRPAGRRVEYAFPFAHTRDSLLVELHWRFAPYLCASRVRPT